MSRIVWFHPRQLLPPRGGGEFRSAGLVQGALAAGHEVLLVYPDDGPEHDEPLPDLLRVTTVTLRTGLSRAAAKVFSRDPLRAPRASRSSMAQARRDIEEFLPDLAIVSQVMSWSLARRLLPDVPWVYDSHNVEHELFGGHREAARGLVDRITFTVDHHRVARAERALLRHSAATLVVAEPDAQGVRAVDPSASLVLVPSSMEPPEKRANPVAAGPVMLFVGSLDFPPNVEALHLLMHEIVPRVRERRPDATLLVVGRRPSSALRTQLESLPWLEFLENAPDVADAYHRARLVLMPFRSGSGTKLKLYEALAFGMPVVATARGIAGVDVRPESEVLVRDDLSGIADAVADVLSDDDLTERLATAARLAFDERLAWQRSAYPPLNALLASFDE